MKRTAARALLFLLIAALMLGSLAVADTGPKPSVAITLTGMPQEDYFITVLGQETGYGPHHTAEAGETPYEWLLSPEDPEGDAAVWQKFVDYKDADGFHFWCDLLEKRSGDTTVTWGYYPPETFKLLLYFPASDTFLESGICERYAFKSSFALDLTDLTAGGTASLPASPTDPVELEAVGQIGGARLAGFAARVAVTLAVELSVALLFRFRSRRQLLSIAAVNLVTQMLLNLCLQWAGAACSYYALWALYLLLEVLVFVVEALLYRRLLVSEGEASPRGRTTLYALVANAASFGAGLLLAGVLPALF